MNNCGGFEIAGLLLIYVIGVNLGLCPWTGLIVCIIAGVSLFANDDHFTL